MAGLGSLAGQTPRASLAREISLARANTFCVLKDSRTINCLHYSWYPSHLYKNLRAAPQENACYATMCNDYNQSGSTKCMITLHIAGEMQCYAQRVSHASRRPPDVILRTSFTRPSTALGDRRPENEATWYFLSREKRRR